jgi:hypothetical protein
MIGDIEAVLDVAALEALRADDDPNTLKVNNDRS